MPPSIRISVPVMNAPSSDTSMAITPATTLGSAIPAPLDSTVVRQDRHQPGKQRPVCVFRDVSAGGIGDPGLDAARRDAHRAQAVLRIFQRQGMGEGLDSALARRVGRHVRDGRKTPRWS